MKALQRSYLPFLFLTLAVLAGFSGSLASSFHFDDYSIFADPALTSTSGWWEAWTRTRPLTYFTFWANHALGGAEPIGYHVFGLLVHLATVLLLYDTLSRLIGRRAALLAAGLFGLHPIQTEPVVYIFARGTLLATLFCVISLRCWLKGRHWVAAAAFAVALLAKEECAAFPVFLLLLHLSISRNRGEWRHIGVMLALSLAAGLRVMWVLAAIPDSGAGAGSEFTAWQYFATQGSVILRYFRLLLIPVGFTVDPQIELATNWRGFASWAAIALMAAGALWRFAKAKEGFWLLAGLVLLLPSSSIFPADDLAADRRMYLPLMAFSAGVALLLERVRLVVPAMIGVALLVVTIGRVEVWRTEQSLWSEAVERSPGKLRPKIQLARVVEDEKALALLEEARGIAPDSPAVASELGRRHLAMGRAAEALKWFGRALALDPSNPLAHNNRGVALSNLGQQEAARADFERALELDPCLFDARHNLKQNGVATPAPSHCRFSSEQRRRLNDGRER
ncbi:MAG: tetratricopeptide repeat protein [bacterium]|nr:tetratricopeptide repeat protein [bacterium]